MQAGGFILFCDMDGTLVTAGGVIPDANQQALSRFVDSGGRFGLATGRFYPSTARYAAQLGVNLPCILTNGAVIYDYNRGKLLWAQYLPPATTGYLEAILYRFPQVRVTVNFLEDRWDVGLSPQRLHPSSYPYYTLEHVRAPLVKVLFHVEAGQLDTILHWMRAQQFPGVYFTASSDHFIELLGEGCSKGSALARLCRLLEVPQGRVAAIGDYDNDREMLGWAGISACPAEAPAQIKALCDYITVGAGQGAVADFLQFLQGWEG